MIIDVRERDELAKEGRVEGALNIPLNELNNNLEAIKNITSNETLELLCRSGSRAQIAKDKLLNLKIDATKIKVIEGGIKGVDAGKVIKETPKTGLSIMRQVMIVAGLMVAGFSLLGIFANPLFHWAPTAIGTALFLAGLSGICPMAILLGKMPWNK